ncbi:hypothetical protein F4805DRAFT_181501 [Annulohypoxylon moriforme]|nr:hypothetical protein F4805DRAFT_181501 [Annulohypoxylon moriforme]
MAKITSRDPAILCAERIAALHFLHHIPVKPTSNPVTAVQNRSAGYTLSFARERDLAGTLAFLAFPKDDINRIPAVCVEEGPNATQINVLLAVNRLGHEGGQQVLKELKKSFDGIFSLLDQDYGIRHEPADTLNHFADNVGSVHSSHIEDDVFTAIVSMCQGRILHRLRLEGRRVQKQSIRGALRMAFDYLKHIELQKRGNNEALSTLSLFIEKAREVLRLADTWVKHQTNAELEDLVKGIQCLRQVDRFEALIEEIPNNIMHPSLRDSLINMISKVARYREAARFLYRMGKKIPLTRKMKAVIVQWPQATFVKPTNSQHSPSLNTTVSLIEGLKDHEKDLEHICRMLNTDVKGESRRLTQEKASERFAEQTCKTLREAKIHAEIQLLYYCELHIPHNRMPRVVCSSKDACWLCNEFILLYEKIHTPKSHGKLYPGWRLPVIKNGDLTERYNVRLQDTLKSSLRTLFTRGKRTVYPDPNESTLLTLYLSDSTLSSVHLPLRDKKGKTVQEVVKEVVVHAEELSTRQLVLLDGEEAVAEVEEVDEVKKVEEIEEVKEVAEIKGVEKVEDIEGEEKTGKNTEELADVHNPLEETRAMEEGNKAEESQAPRDTEEAREVEEEVGEVQDTEEMEDMTLPPPNIWGGISHNSYDGHDPSERWSSGCSSSSSEGSLTLEFDKVRSKKIWMGKSTPLYNVGPPLNIQIKYAKSKNPETPNTPKTPNNLHKKLSYSLERLRPEDVEKLRDRGVVPIAGADLPGYWVDNNTDEEGYIYISNGDSVAKLRLRPILE